MARFSLFLDASKEDLEIILDNSIPYKDKTRKLAVFNKLLSAAKCMYTAASFK